MKVLNSILVVDDEPELLENIGMTLELANYHVLTANNGLEALTMLRKWPVDLILADIAMPDMNGYQLLERVRENGLWAPIPFIFLTARKMDSDIRYGKSLGVDDYLTKPITAVDLLAVVAGKLRRAEFLQPPSPSGSSLANEDQIIAVGALRINPGRYQVFLNGEEIRLSLREFVLLETFARNPNDVLSSRDLIRITQNGDDPGLTTDVAVRSMIHALRRKMGGCILNVRGQGYRLVMPEN
ncbi:MAG: response regulator transcription factor [Anaerolineae bacterium]|nr:response regulator transcription factor [Anaerolineae bacterium]